MTQLLSQGHEAAIQEDESLETLLTEWVTQLNKAGFHTGEQNPFEARIIELAARRERPSLDCMLYRGTGVPDCTGPGVLAGSISEIPASKRLFTSWSKDIEVARSFMDDAQDGNQSAVLLAVHSSRLDIIVDIGDFPEVDEEREVLTRSVPLRVTEQDILEAWEYDEDLGYCVRIHGDAAVFTP